MLPLLDLVVVNTTQGQQLIFAINHLLSSGSCERVIFHQKNSFFGTNFLAVAAEDAAEHVDVKPGRDLLAVGPGGRGGLDGDAFGGAGRGAHVTGHAFDPALLILCQFVEAAVPCRNRPLLLGVLHSEPFPEQVPER